MTILGDLRLDNLSHAGAAEPRDAIFIDLQNRNKRN